MEVTEVDAYVGENSYSLPLLYVEEGACYVGDF